MSDSSSHKSKSSSKNSSFVKPSAEPTTGIEDPAGISPPLVTVGTVAAQHAAPNPNIVAHEVVAPLFAELEKVEIPGNILEIANFMENAFVIPEPDEGILAEYNHYVAAELQPIPLKEGLNSEQSFHSYHTGTSTHIKMEAMTMKNIEKSTSGSRKRKMAEVVVDTTTSGKKRTKKAKK